MARLYGLQNTYLLLEYSSVLTVLTADFAFKWSLSVGDMTNKHKQQSFALSNISLSAVGQRGLLSPREGLWLYWPSSLLGYASAYTLHTTAVREQLDYCDSSLSDIVCNFYMVDEVK